MYPQNKHNILKNKVKLKPKVLVVLMGMVLFTTSCSSDNKPIKVKNTIVDPVKVTVKGINKDVVLNNVNAYIASLPTISKKRARLYDREIKENIQTALHAYGYYHPSVKLTYPKADDKLANEVVADIDVGKPLYIRNAQIDIIGQGSDYQAFYDIIKASNIKSYKLLDHGAYKELKEDLLNKAIELGFFDASFSVARILVYQEQNAADITLLLDTKKRYHFGQIIADDETKNLLKPSNSLINFTEGQDFSSKTLEKFSSSLSLTKFYKAVDVRALVEDRKDNKVPVKVNLARNSNNLFRVGLGYSTDEQIRGILGWDKPLINESGHSFNSYLRVSSVKQDAQAIYKIPHKNPNLDYFYIKAAQIHTDYNDTLSDLSHASFHYVANMLGKWRRDYYLAAEYEDYTQGLEDDFTTNLMLGLQLSRRSTTGGMDPKTGYSITFDNKFATSAITDLNFWHSQLDIRGVLSPSENTRFIYKLYQGATIGSDALKVPPSMRFFAGGEKTLRGFSYKDKAPLKNEKLKGGRYLTATTAELNFPIGITNARGAVFLDSAICTDDYKKDRNILLGPGIGFRYLSDYGIFKLDIAYGIDHDEDDRQIKLHLSFGPEF